MPTLYTLTCQACGASFNTHRSTSRYCSKTCYHVARRTRPILVCVVCGKPFKRRANGGTNLYCSKTCKGIGTQVHKPRQCAVCGKEFRPKSTSKRSVGRYCSRDCQHKAQRIHPPRPCATCGKMFIPPTGKQHETTKWCSRHCKGVASRGDSPRAGKNFTKRQRLAILERDGYQCVVCHSTERVQVDHILAVAKGGDNSIENGQTLCWNCHYQKTRGDLGQKAKGCNSPIS